MNVKMLFFPLSVTVALLVAVFYVQPEIGTAMTNHAAFVEKKALAESATLKIRNAQELEKNLNANKDSEDAIMRYLPNTRDDERIVDAMNFLLTQSGLALTSVKIDKVAEIETPVDAADTAAEDSSVLFAGSAADTANQAPVIMAKPKVLDVTVAAIGSYESIRDAVSKVSHMDRFQNVVSVDVDRSTDAVQSSDGQTGVSNVLSASLKISFTYLPKVNAKGNFNLPLLANTNFDFGTVGKLKQYTSSSVPSIEVGTAGAANPFLR